MHLTRRNFGGLGLGALGWARPARADAYPSKSIRVVVPYSAGSASDVLSRLVFDKLASEIGQTILIDNKPGAGGSIGEAIVARAEPDGYTLLETPSGHTNIPTLYPNAPFDTVNGFAAVVPLGNIPVITVVAAQSPLKTLRELVEAGKSRPDGLSFASAGIGSGSHFAGERLRLSAGFKAVHVPYKGGPEAVADTVTGRVDFFPAPLSLVLAFIQDGRLRALATSSPKRAVALPDVPTTLESGFADSDYTLWSGLLAPAKTPADIIAKLHDSIERILSSPDMRAKLSVMGVDPLPMSPMEFDAQVHREIAANAIVIKAAGIKGE